MTQHETINYPILTLFNKFNLYFYLFLPQQFLWDIYYWIYENVVNADITIFHGNSV